MRVEPGLLALLVLASAAPWACGGTRSDAPVAAYESPRDEPTEELDDDEPTGRTPGKDGGRSDAKPSDAETPPSGDGGRYDGLESLTEGALRDALLELVKDHTSLGYDGARDAMLGITAQFDLKGGLLECVYTGREVAPDGTRTPNGFNTEHTWPQSLGASAEPARSDLHHLFPVDEIANNARGSLPFANTDCAGGCGYDNGSKRGTAAGGTVTVFQVRPERRGDIARAMFYFAVRYQYTIDALEEASLRQWNASDPPDALELTRNDAIESYQANRNPFVDRPDFVERIGDF